ncbi:galactoside-binding lectin [Ancylostoma duodenale]|uniref:Galectin n=1 Tax=Ancylostoma duodenale TaxID=51022 RepID=A0A0C2D470_9BILA|nr:galactoside-binding lectin [Ancylostoma duodenale]
MLLLDRENLKELIREQWTLVVKRNCLVKCNKELKEYEHRLPLSSITHFSIDGDVLITHIHWGGKYYPVPYESGLAGEGLSPGKSLLLFGMPEKKGKRFHINILKKNGDIALHFNPRFDEKAVVRNSLISNEWGNEEREGKMPFEKAVGFDLEIKNEEYAFQVRNFLESH